MQIYLVFACEREKIVFYYCLCFELLEMVSVKITMLILDVDA